jgi:hypothetical protein
MNDIRDYVNRKRAESYDHYGIDYHIDPDVFERIYLDGVKTGIAALLGAIDDFIDAHT